MRRLRTNKQNKLLLPTITLTPLIDTILVLLVVFMVTASSKVVTTPVNKKSSAAQKARPDDYRVVYMYVASDGMIVVNGHAQDLKSVIKNMASFVAQSPIKTVFIKSEEAANCKIIHALVDTIHKIPGARVIVS